MTKFLTVKEAAHLVGKSPSSIRRIIYPILEDNRHPDRHHIEPDAATAKSLRVKGENFAWKLSEELLRREVPDGTTSKTDSKKETSEQDQSDAIVEILRNELTIKNEQIAAQNEVIKGLSERVREGNILMSSFQQHLSLLEGPTRNKSQVVDAKEKSQMTERGSDAPAEPPRKPHWLFRKIF